MMLKIAATAAMLLTSAPVFATREVLLNETTSGCRHVIMLFTPPKPPALDVDDDTKVNTDGRRMLQELPPPDSSTTCTAFIQKTCNSCLLAQGDARKVCIETCFKNNDAAAKAAGCFAAPPPPTNNTCIEFVKLKCPECKDSTGDAFKACASTCIKANVDLATAAGCQVYVPPPLTPCQIYIEKTCTQCKDLAADLARTCVQNCLKLDPVKANENGCGATQPTPDGGGIPQGTQDPCYVFAIKKCPDCLTSENPQRCGAECVMTYAAEAKTAGCFPPLAPGSNTNGTGIVEPCKLATQKYCPNCLAMANVTEAVICGKKCALEFSTEFAQMGCGLRLGDLPKPPELPKNTTDCGTLFVTLCGECKTFPTPETQWGCLKVCFERNKPKFEEKSCKMPEVSRPPPEQAPQNASSCKPLINAACSCQQVYEPIARTVCLSKCLAVNKDAMDIAGCRPPNNTMGNAPEVVKGTFDRCTNLFAKTCGGDAEKLNRTALAICFQANKELFAAEKCIPKRPPQGSFDDSFLSKIVIHVDDILGKLPEGSVSVEWVVGDKFSIKVDAYFPVATPLVGPTDPTEPDVETGASSVSLGITAAVSGGGSNSASSSAKAVSTLVGSAAAAASLMSGSANRAACSVVAGLAMASSYADAQATCAVKVAITITHRALGPVQDKPDNQKFQILKDAITKDIKKEIENQAGGSGRLLRDAVF